MRLSLAWMRDYAPLDAPLQSLVAALIDTGIEVDQVHREAAGGVVARIVELQPVPESTRGVRFADLDVGAEQAVRVITGAPNVAVGMLVPYAPPGTRLPGLDEPLGVRAMFGGKYQSPGMICSAVELGLGEDAEGIMVLERGLPGQPLHEVLDLDTVLEVEVTPNRPDAMCHLGAARELAASLAEGLREPTAEIPEVRLSATGVEARLEVRVEDAAGCPRFCARIIDDVVVAPSPAWLQRRLRGVGLRPINNVVDVTNYVLAEFGQPLHAFDLERFRSAAGAPQGRVEVVVRRGRGEPVLCLDGVERELGPADLAVCAGERAVSVAGVIGGAETAVDERSRSVLLEAASWDGATIRATSRRLGVRTEASAHFEKGLSDRLPPPALERAAALIAELGGGRVLRGVVDDHRGALPPIPAIAVPEAMLDRVLGYPVDVSEAATALARLGFAVEQDGSSMVVTPPAVRRDVRIAVDVAEEVGRSLGYARVPSTLPGRRSPLRALAPQPPLEDRVRDTCAGAGFDEVITYSFIAPQQVRALEGIGGERAAIPLRNPLSQEWSVMRTSVLPGLCLALATNLNRGTADLSLFEVGRVYWEGERRHPPAGSTADQADRGLPPLPAEPLVLGLLSQTGDGGGESAAGLLRDQQALLAWLAHELAGASLSVEPRAVRGLRQGRSGTLRVEGREVGIVGELETSVVEAFAMRGRVVAAELRLDAVAPEVPRTPRFHAPPRYPAVVRDLSVTVPVAQLVGTALATIEEAGRPLLESAECIDDYRDQRLGETRKSWTFRLTYRADDRTLTSGEAQLAHDAIAAALEVRCAAETRR